MAVEAILENTELALQDWVVVFIITLPNICHTFQGLPCGLMYPVHTHTLSAQKGAREGAGWHLGLEGDINPGPDSFMLAWDRIPVGKHKKKLCQAVLRTGDCHH
jgi:hypothetical protein